MASQQIAQLRKELNQARITLADWSTTKSLKETQNNKTAEHIKSLEAEVAALKSKLIGFEKTKKKLSDVEKQKADLEKKLSETEHKVFLADASAMIGTNASPAVRKSLSRPSPDFFQPANGSASAIKQSKRPSGGSVTSNYEVPKSGKQNSSIHAVVTGQPKKYNTVLEAADPTAQSSEVEKQVFPDQSSLVVKSMKTNEYPSSPHSQKQTT